MVHMSCNLGGCRRPVFSLLIREGLLSIRVGLMIEVKCRISASGKGGFFPDR